MKATIDGANITITYGRPFMKGRKIFGGLVGSSEENIRTVIKTAEAVAPAILWIDELEKGFSGTGSSGQTDGGTTSRVFASFITWTVCVAKYWELWTAMSKARQALGALNEARSLGEAHQRLGRSSDPVAQLLRTAVQEVQQSPHPDPDSRLDLGALMEGRASDPRAWPMPFTINGTTHPALIDLGGGHFVRADPDGIAAIGRAA